MRASLLLSLVVGVSLLSSTAAAKSVPLPAAHATFEAPEGWMVAPMPPAMALTKFGEATQFYVYPATGSSVEDGRRAVEALYPGSGAVLKPRSLPGHAKRASEVSGIERLFGFPTKSSGYFVWSPHGDAVLVLAFNPNFSERDVEMARALATSVRFAPLKRSPPVALELGSVWQGVTLRGQSPAGFVLEQGNERELMLKAERPMRALTLTLSEGKPSAEALEQLARQLGMGVEGKPAALRGGLWAKVAGQRRGQPVQGYLGLRSVTKDQLVVGMAVGGFSNQQDLVRVLSGLKASATRVPPKAAALMQTLKGNRLTTIDVGNGWSREIEWNFCSDGTYSYRSNSGGGATHAGASASWGRRNNHRGRWMTGVKNGQTVIEVLTSEGESATFEIRLLRQKGRAAIVGGEELEYFTSSETCR